MTELVPTDGLPSRRAGSASHLETESKAPRSDTDGAGSVSSTRPDTAEAHRKAVQRAIQAMRERMEEELSLDDLAEVGIMSPYHFSRVFRRVTGLPPARFLSALRLQAAKRLLLSTDESITDICFEVGYNSLGTFSRRFTEVVGISPRGFRQLGRRGVRAAISFLKAQSQFPTFAGGSGIAGTIDAPERFSGPVFVGLFPKGIPEGRPAACSILGGAGRYRLGPVADGTYHLFATGIAWSLEAQEYLLYDQALRGEVSKTVVVEGGSAASRTDLALKPPTPIHPPILMAIPLLLNERFRKAPAAPAAAEEGLRAG